MNRAVSREVVGSDTSLDHFCCWQFQSTVPPSGSTDTCQLVANHNQSLPLPNQELPTEGRVIPAPQALTSPLGGRASARGGCGGAGALDSLCISRTFKNQRTNKTRFSGNCFHTREFSLWAIDRAASRWGYLGLDAFGDPQTYSGHLLMRWSAERQKQNLALVYSWAEAQQSGVDAVHIIYGDGVLPLNSAHFLTLTVRHGIRGTYPEMLAALDVIRSAWHTVARQLRRLHARYLRVIEPGEKRGYPHIHLIVAGLTDQQAAALIDAWVLACNRRGNLALVEGQDWQRVDDIQNVGAYLAKYLTKSIKPEIDTSYWRWMEICYREGIRCLSMDAKSRAYIHAKYPKSLPGGIGLFEVFDG